MSGVVPVCFSSWEQQSLWLLCGVHVFTMCDWDGVPQALQQCTTCVPPMQYRMTFVNLKVCLDE